jgi:hypothetical protein
MLVTITRALLILVIGIGGLAALTGVASAEPTPQNCNVAGDRVCGVGGPHGPRAGHCPDGGRYAVRQGYQVCAYGPGDMPEDTSDGDSSGGGGKPKGKAAPEPPVIIPGVNVDVPPLPATYVDPSYQHQTATRESVFGTAGAYGGSHP